jgi:hypothetical protein
MESTKHSEEEYCQSSPVELMQRLPFSTAILLQISDFRALSQYVTAGRRVNGIPPDRNSLTGADQHLEQAVCFFTPAVESS